MSEDQKTHHMQQKEDDFDSAMPASLSPVSSSGGGSPLKEFVDQHHEPVPDFPEPVLRVPQEPVGTRNYDGDNASHSSNASAHGSSNNVNSDEDGGEDDDHSSDDDSEEIVFGESYSGDEGTKQSHKKVATKNVSKPSQQDQHQSSDANASIGNSKGAQILMNRFSTWRQTANQNAQELLKPVKLQAKLQAEGVGQLWKQGPAVDFQRNIRSSLQELRKPVPTASASASSQNEKNQQAGTTPDSQGESANVSFVDNASSIGDEEDEVSSDNSEPATGNTSVATSTTTDQDCDYDNDNGNSVPLPRVRVGQALTKASTAASVVAESMTTNFRGRYTPSKSPASSADGTLEEKARSKAPKPGEPESQTELILKSRAAKHMQEILDGLESHEYAMLLGSGMLGVNLKQCYLKNHGVYVDFLVHGGQAQQSGVVRAGDLLVRLGNVDLRKGTIVEIPGTIASARRPEALVLATGTKSTIDRVNYVDIAVAMMHRARNFYNERGSLANKLMEPDHKADEVSETSIEENSSGDNIKPAQSVEEITAPESVSKVRVPVDESLDAYLTPPVPPLDLREEFLNETARRSNDKFIVSGLSQVAELDSNFRNAVRNAFLTVATDSRRLPFLARHFSSEESMGSNHHEDSDQEDSRSGQLSPSAYLMLYLELTSFLDLYDLTPAARRRDVALRIAHKFFLPTKTRDELQPPLFDFHQIVADSSLRRIETVLKSKESQIPHDLFLDFHHAVVSSLIGTPFISFLGSIECSRMRAHLRGTAPFMNAPLSKVISSVTSSQPDSNAQNYLAYVLIFLVCQLEKEPVGEHNFIGDESPRLVSAASGLCCSLFIRKTLLPMAMSCRDDGDKRALVNLFERFWHCFMDGSLKKVSKSNETEIVYKSVKIMLEKISAKNRLGSETKEISTKLTDALLSPKTLSEIQILADELLYDYAVSSHIKFREHKFHEWMCTESAKKRTPPVSTTNAPRDIPSLELGCIKQVLRRIELPEGVSSHKPYKIEGKTNLRNYHNADFAIVFGTTVEDYEDHSTQEGVTKSYDSCVRRFTSQSVALDKEEGNISLVDKDVIPPTLENYAMAPPMKHAPFSSVFDVMRTSDDGWEISLVNFAIPNAESTSGDATDSALFGVSLTFTLGQNQAYRKELVKTELCANNAAAIDGNKFESPISLDDVSTVVGIALVSTNNVTMAMRDTLSRLLKDFLESESGGSDERTTRCGPLVELLGTFSQPGIESASLRNILEPYLRAAMSPWTDSPLVKQREAFENLALQQLTDCIPPTPLALMFVTALLEQKIVFSSSRRSVLHSACLALATMLRPLKWSHLLVPLVPSSLANDLIHYPAPYILGIPAQDAENMELLSTLPRDVTLVDLDVGRVILAPSFGNDNEMVDRAEDTNNTAQALRSQVLYLAQALGNVFGSSLHSLTWRCDSPSMGRGISSEDSNSRINDLRNTMQELIEELLAGVEYCAYWIEEASLDNAAPCDPTVLFDEDQFLSIKARRASGETSSLFATNSRPARLAVSPQEFELVLQSFLRCQSMSSFISSRPKEEMVYY